jgi:hypothetical protein
MLRQWGLGKGPGTASSPSLSSGACAGAGALLWEGGEWCYLFPSEAVFPLLSPESRVGAPVLFDRTPSCVPESAFVLWLPG